ncbi:MAG: tetratricopeptide repeat protein [Candidatus Scalindua sp.]|nr:tetratricopeptide repeat protein [Candidatus Scalindua sp.]
MSLAGVTSEKDAIKVGELLSANIVCIITISGSARNQNDALFQTSFKIIEVETGKILITGMFINAVDGLAKLFDKLSSDYLANRAYLNIQQAVEYMNQSNYDSAVVSFQTALNYFRSQEDAESLKVVGILYNNIGATFQKNEMWSKALEYFKKSINHNSRIGKNEPVLSLTHQHLCEIYIANSDYKNAEKHGKKAVAINKANNDLTGECEAMHLLLSVYEMNSNKRQARRIKKRMDELLCG